ncbi:MAG: hypothetical protein ACYSW4_02345 [Planctomycetota bacterium]|jgi:hypothetical protein
MEKAVERILKAKDVKLEGCLRLDVVQAPPSPAKKNGTVLQPTAVRIVENQPEFAVTEITCSCGTKMYLRCEYARAEPSAQQQPPDQASNQTK